MSARIHHNGDRCQSTGVCEVTAPEIFLLDDEGIPQFNPDVPPELLTAPAPPLRPARSRPSP